MEIDENEKIIISTHKENALYFSVGVSNSTGKIVRISLPKQDKELAVAEISTHYSEFEVSDKYADIAKTVSKVYEGEKVDFNLGLLDLGVYESKNKNSPIKTQFERNVLVKTTEIPSGQVRTYKYIAEKLGNRAYRAVGTALGKNPFPIIIPCHRVVKSDLSIGQYGGGSKMKKQILKNEGVRIKGDKIVAY